MSSNTISPRDRAGRLARDRTTVLVAHRLHTAMDADRIVVLDSGRVVETGSHDKLLRARRRGARPHLTPRFPPPVFYE